MKPSVFVTGADKGLGFALVRRFLQGGFRVFGGVYTDESSLVKLAAEFSNDLHWVWQDVSNLEMVRRSAQQVAGMTVGLDILINNAGIHPEDSSTPLEGLDLANGKIERSMDVNAYGPLRVTQQFIPLLENGQMKRLVYISSEAGSIGDCPRKTEFGYTMSKAALNMVVKLLYNYLHPRGYQVTAIHPGWMRTDMGGPNADISADEAAESIYQLALQERREDAPIFMERDGKTKVW